MPILVNLHYYKNTPQKELPSEPAVDQTWDTNGSRMQCRALGEGEQVWGR